MNDSILLLNLSNTSLVDSIVKSSCNLCNKELAITDPLIIRSGNLELSSFGIALLACFIAIVTCVYTILMYKDVKRQLDIAKEQLEKQKKDNLLEKKHKFNYRFNELYNLIIDHESYLVKKEISVEIIKEETDYYDKVIDCIKDVELYLGYMKDLIGVIDKNGEKTREKIDEIKVKLEEIKTRNGVADNNNDVDSWIDNLVEKKEEIISLIEESYSVS